MKLKRSLLAIATALLLLALGSAARAELIEINFDELEVGTVITDQYSGLTFSLLGSTSTDGLWVLALEDYRTGEGLNIFGASGNVFTSSELDESDLTAVAGPIYDVEIVFDEPIDYFSILVLDAEEAITILGYFEGELIQSVDQGTLLGTKSDSPFRGAVYEITLGSIGGDLLFDRIVLDLTDGNQSLAGPEEFDLLRFNTVERVPEPASLESFGSGLVLLALMGLADRRRRFRGQA